jgi:hypothetical protein
MEAFGQTLVWSRKCSIIRSVCKLIAFAFNYLVDYVRLLQNKIVVGGARSAHYRGRAV